MSGGWSENSSSSFATPDEQEVCVLHTRGYYDHGGGGTCVKWIIE